MATRQYKKLPHTFIYLFSFFLLADVRRLYATYYGTRNNSCCGSSRDSTPQGHLLLSFKTINTLSASFTIHTLGLHRRLHLQRAHLDSGTFRNTTRSVPSEWWVLCCSLMARSDGNSERFDEFHSQVFCHECRHGVDSIMGNVWNLY